MKPVVFESIDVFNRWRDAILWVEAQRRSGHTGQPQIEGAVTPCVVEVTGPVSGGVYPAKFVYKSVEDSGWEDMTDVCWAVGLNDEPLAENKRYAGRVAGYYNNRMLTAVTVGGTGDGSSLLCHVVSVNTGTTLHTVRRNTLNTSTNEIEDFGPETLYEQCKSTTGRTLPVGTVVKLNPIPDVSGYYWITPAADATEALPGLLNAATQSIGGVKTFHRDTYFRENVDVTGNARVRSDLRVDRNARVFLETDLCGRVRVGPATTPTGIPEEDDLRDGQLFVGYVDPIYITSSPAAAYIGTWGLRTAGSSIYAHGGEIVATPRLDTVDVGGSGRVAAVTAMFTPPGGEFGGIPTDGYVAVNPGNCSRLVQPIPGQSPAASGGGTFMFRDGFVGMGTGAPYKLRGRPKYVTDRDDLGIGLGGDTVQVFTDPTYSATLRPTNFLVGEPGNIMTNSRYSVVASRSISEPLPSVVRFGIGSTIRIATGFPPLPYQVWEFAGGILVNSTFETAEDKSLSLSDMVDNPPVSSDGIPVVEVMETVDDNGAPTGQFAIANVTPADPISQGRGFTGEIVGLDGLRHQFRDGVYIGPESTNSDAFEFTGITGGNTAIDSVIAFLSRYNQTGRILNTVTDS